MASVLDSGRPVRARVLAPGPRLPGDAEAIELTILMPCLDEAETLATCIRKAWRFLQRCGVSGEVVVADNGSTDGSIEIALVEGARVVNVPQRGYGAALIAGTREARGRFVIMGDSDDSYDFTALLPFLEQLRAGQHLVIGNRFKGGIAAGAMPPLHRFIGNPLLSGVGRLFFRAPLGDFHCGLRGFDRAAVLRLGLACPGMEFASEMIVKAVVHGLRVAEVPTTLSPAGRSRRPHLRSFRDGWRHLRFLLLFSPSWLFLYPGLALFAMGVAGMALLLPGPWTVGQVTFDVGTLTFASAGAVCGVQSVVFWLVAHAFAGRLGLLSPSAHVSWIRSRVPLELALVIGAALCVAGIGAALLAVSSWGSVGFGALDPARSARAAIGAATALTLGVQVVLGSFLLALMGMERRI